ncbi:MAG: DNA cytosine methyltransferase [Agitococcus sp.]|nr:DNA cytosine methyltransferase [Agitococcus sp.]
MKYKSLNLFPEELIIDNFAGGGGTSTGLEQAFGRPVDIAINHDPEALAMHRANHPHTKHHCESVWDVDPIEVTGNQPVGLVWLSPDCKHFSKAKGGKPVEKRIRGLAWVGLRWAALTRPRILILENVEEFKTWGPIANDGRPCPIRKGKTFNSFVNALKHQGYAVEYRELRACDYGAPTIRKRFFLIARRDGLPIKWPQPTHGESNSLPVKSGKLKPWRTAADCIDWTNTCPSIFERTKPLADATCRRIAAGLMRYVVKSESPFIVKCNHTASYYNAFRGQNLSDPLQTITSAPGFSLVAPVLTEIANASSPRCMQYNEPLRTICAQVKGGHHALVTAFINTYYGAKREGETRGIDLGQPLRTQTTENRHGVVTAFLAKNYTGVVGSQLSEPVHTVTAIDHNSLVTSNLIKLKRGSIGSTNDSPIPTITTKGHLAEVRAFLVAYYGNDKEGQSLTDSMRTIPTHDRFGLVTVEGQQYEITDIGLRMLQPRELFTAQGFPSDYIIDHGIDERGNKIKLSKTAQTRMCGNSVCPPVAHALIEANFKHEMAWRAA